MYERRERPVKENPAAERNPSFKGDYPLRMTVREKIKEVPWPWGGASDPLGTMRR